MSHAGYHKAIDHMAVVRVDGESHVILEPTNAPACLLRFRYHLCQG